MAASAATATGHHSLKSTLQRRRQAEGGFTLLETVLAMAILATALIGLARLVVGSHLVNERGARATRAVALATAVVETFKTAAPSDVFLQAGGDLSRAVTDGAGSRFLDSGPLQARWRISRPGDGTVWVQVVVVERAAGRQHRLARLFGVREGGA